MVASVTPSSLLVLAGERTYAFPLSAVGETLRPLPVEPFAGMPLFMLGMAVVRGTALPVLDLAALQEGRAAGAPARFVTVKRPVGDMVVAVDTVVGTAVVPRDQLEAPPTLLGAAREAWIDAFGHLDGRLLVLVAPEALPSS